MDNLQQFDEAKAFLLDRIPEAIRALGKNHETTFKMQRMYAQCLYQNADASQDDVTTAIAQLEDLDRRTTRTYGAAHPQTSSTHFCPAPNRNNSQVFDNHLDKFQLDVTNFHQRLQNVGQMFPKKEEEHKPILANILQIMEHV